MDSITLPREDIATAIRARHLHTPIDRVHVYPPETPYPVVRQEMEAAGYDYALVGADGVAAAILDRRTARRSRRPVGQLTSPMTSRDLISADTPLPGVLDALATRTPFLLTVSQTGLSGVVAPSDLNKQPGRTYYYLLVATLEMSIAGLLRESFPDQSPILQLLNSRRRSGALGRLARSKEQDSETDVVAALDLEDLLQVSLKDPVTYTATWASLDPADAESLKKQVLDLRHDVMHPARTLASDTQPSLERLVRLDIALRQILGRFEDAGTGLTDGS